MVFTYLPQQPTAQNRNVQSQYLEGLSRGCIGFVGVTENNNASLEIINHERGLNLSQQHSDINPNKTISKDKASAELCARVRGVNKRELELSHWALENHKARHRLFTEAAQRCLGFYTLMRNAQLHRMTFKIKIPQPRYDHEAFIAEVEQTLNYHQSVA
jgi:hypothetical protein